MLVVLDVSRLSSAGNARSDIGHVACSFWDITAAMRYSTFRLDFALQNVLYSLTCLKTLQIPTNPMYAALATSC